MIPPSEAEEIDISKEERKPLNQEFQQQDIDPESLDQVYTDVEAIDLHESLRHTTLNLSMFNMKTFFHPKKSEDEGLYQDFQKMALQSPSESYEDIEGQMCEGERVQDLQNLQEDDHGHKLTSISEV